MLVLTAIVAFGVSGSYLTGEARMIKTQLQNIAS